MKLYRILLVCALALPILRISAAQNDASTAERTTASDAAQQVRLGAPIQAANPDIPKQLRKKQLVAVLSATVATDGSMKNVKTLGGDPEFSELALNAVQHWLYSPATLNGQPVEAKVFVTLQSQKGKIHSDVEPDTLPTELSSPPSKSANEPIVRVDMRAMKPPKPLYTPDPQYSEKARKARYRGVAVVGLVLGRDGRPKAVWMVRRLGLGLDEKALEAVRQWKFSPATKDGEPATVQINVEVTFRLY